MSIPAARWAQVVGDIAVQRMPAIPQATFLEGRVEGRWPPAACSAAGASGCRASARAWSRGGLTTTVPWQPTDAACHGQGPMSRTPPAATSPAPLAASCTRLDRHLRTSTHLLVRVPGRLVVQLGAAAEVVQVMEPAAAVGGGGRERLPARMPEADGRRAVTAGVQVDLHPGGGRPVLLRPAHNQQPGAREFDHRPAGDQLLAVVADPAFLDTAAEGRVEIEVPPPATRASVSTIVRRTCRAVAAITINSSTMSSSDVAVTARSLGDAPTGQSRSPRHGRGLRGRA